MRFEDAIDMMRAVSETNRLRLLALCARGQMSVGELVGILGQSQPSVSRHLSILTNVGLIERYRDGKYRYYRVPDNAEIRRYVRSLLALVDPDDKQLQRDDESFESIVQSEAPPSLIAERKFNRAVLRLAAEMPIGALLDIGMGSARLMPLLAGSAARIIGVDNDRVVRHSARRALAAAGLANCSILAGDMYRLPVDHGEFQTVVIDELLYCSESPLLALSEAQRVLEPGGRVIIVERFELQDNIWDAQEKIAQWLSKKRFTRQKTAQVLGDKVSWLLFSGVNPNSSR